MLRFPRAIPLLAVICLAGAGCSGDGTDATPATAATSASADPATPDPSAATVVTSSSGGRRWGDGRALAARFDPIADRTVVATTIGVSVQTGDAAPVVLREGLPGLLAMSADGHLVAFTTADDRLEIWDLDTARPVAGFDVPLDRYTSLAFSSATDVIAGGEGDVTRFPADAGAPERLVEPPADGTLGPVALGADGTVAVPVGSATPTVVVWRAGTAAGPTEMAFPDGTQLVGVVWSPDERHLAVLHQPPAAGESVAIWDVAAATFRGAVAIPNYVVAEQVVFAGTDRVVIPLADRLAAFDLDGSEVDARPIPSSAVPEMIGFSVGDAVGVVGWDGLVQRWSPGSALAEVAPATYNLVDTSVPAGTDEVVVVDHYGTIRRLDVAGAVDLATIDHYAVGESNSVSVSPDAQYVAVGTSTGAVRVLRTADGTEEQELDRPEGNVAAVAYAPSAPLLATGLGVQLQPEVWNDAVAVTDLTDDRTVTSFGGEQENVTGCSFFKGAIDFSPDGTLLAASSHDYTVEVTAVGDGEDGGAVLDPHLGTVLDVEFSPDGSLLATSSEDGTLRIWDVDGWTQRDELMATAGGYWALAFTPDGSALAVSDVSGTVSLLDIETGELIRTFAGAKDQAGDMAFTPDGTRLVAGAPGGPVDVWSVASGEVERRMEGHTMSVTDVAVTPDGTAAVSSSLDGTVRYWSLDA